MQEDITENISKKNLFDKISFDNMNMNKSFCIKFVKNNLFLICTLVGVVLGVVIGITLRPLGLSNGTITLIAYPGEIFMRSLKLMILPFVISCLIIGTATLNIGKNSGIAIKTLIYFLVTSGFNVCLGIILVLTIHPGNPEHHTNVTQKINTNSLSVMDGFLDMGRNIVPDNIFQASFEQTYTEYVPVKSSIVFNESNSNQSESAQLKVNNIDYKRKLQVRRGTNTIGIIFFCILFGSVLGTLGPQKQVVIDFFTVIYQVLLRILLGVIWMTPLGVGSVICSKIITIENLSQTMVQLSWFILTAAIGFYLYQLIFLQMIYYFFVKKNPYKYYMTFFPGIITAYATASKAAALPITFQILDEKVKADQRITRFILPIGSLNMDGTALFLPVSVIFIAQINNINIGPGDVFVLGITCLAVSMSSTAVPSAALILVVMVCSVINAPPEDVSLLFAVDWFVDRMRTTNNLLGDIYACAVIEKLSKNDLDKSDEEQNAE